ncbi:MAG: FAD-binding protein [Phaeovulum sp.]|uniref:FAD-binding protein n=1 Tax=Phaeovulum sp. TaxID=2934796 RepID=UPI0027320CA9|nr:FAD-binding protein [Phaeovulum sp.]MDP2062730.1 FAD-binding protein [Phaeovulum sp.]MDP3863028.1 FAD-binding protein [Phaeovulum sp.]
MQENGNDQRPYKWREPQSYAGGGWPRCRCDRPCQRNVRAGGAGGYGGNTALLEAYSDPNAGAMMVRGIKHATGDGLLMAQRAGAGLKGMGGLMALHIAAVDGVETAAGQPARVVPYAISINRDGKRFVDESAGYVPMARQCFRSLVSLLRWCSTSRCAKASRRA